MSTSFTKLLVRFRSKEGYTVFFKTTDNSSGRELSAFLPYSDTHAPVQGLRDLEAKKRNAVDNVYSLLHAAQ